ncbi:hypothetical protein EOM89_14140, partial [Candidatus Falkowbacteria bacterium]|nr:hypothetical protein [Candidatus Falkowbacteria bacterium]
FGFYDIGLLRSDDAGQTFRRGVQGVPHALNNSCFDLAFDPEQPDRLWGAFGQWGSNQGILAQSADAGMTWAPLPAESGLPNARCRRLIRQGNALLAALDEHGVYASGDLGRTWQAANEGLPTTTIQALQPVPGMAQAFVCALGSKGKELGGIYRSDDGCGSWQRISGGFPVGDVKSLAIAPSDPQVLYLDMRDQQVSDLPVPGGVYRSDDGGATWKQVLRNHFVQGLAVHPTQPKTVLAGLNDHPYHDQSTGGGGRRTSRASIRERGRRPACRRANSLRPSSGRPRKARTRR